MGLSALGVVSTAPWTRLKGNMLLHWVKVGDIPGKLKRNIASGRRHNITSGEVLLVFVAVHMHQGFAEGRSCAVRDLQTMRSQLRRSYVTKVSRSGGTRGRTGLNLEVARGRWWRRDHVCSPTHARALVAKALTCCGAG